MYFAICGVAVMKSIFFTGLSAVIFELLEDFEEAWSTGNAERFEARGHGEADRFFSVAGVGDDEVCSQRV
ncbi:MAG: hypothetical protein MR847_00450 [Hallerella sp.]|nr:hypothetical protein [Hallerella sp.]MCI6872603.1 hypothetical protein [Hallerella sp.]